MRHYSAAAAASTTTNTNPIEVKNDHMIQNEIENMLNR